MALNLVFPTELGDDAQRGDMDSVCAWLDSGGSVDRPVHARSFHRDVLTVRGLAQRGKLSTDDPVLNFLARLGDNGVVWHVLEYWRATN